MSITAAKGFVAAGGACGIKDGGVPDLAVVATADGRPVTAGGVFTTNLVAAAPVQASREHLFDGRAAAITLNSGNANAATGEGGRAAARRMCELTGDAIGCAITDVLVCSTGLIGIPLPLAPLESGIPKIAGDRGPTPEHGLAAATAIMTTDTKAKQATAIAVLPGGMKVTVGGMAKGAAMLSPAMATMLCAITSDAAVESATLNEALHDAVGASFDNVVVDGCRSTNDTVLVLANGAAGNPTINSYGERAAFYALRDALTEVCCSLAEQMARDAEGATKLARIEVRGARSRDDARLAARTVAHSQLVQCSLYGCDPYWGRVLSECGASGAYFDPERVDIAYSGITVARNGIACEHDAGALAEAMHQHDIEIVVDLHCGDATASVLTTDLTHAYVDENMGTS
jgi:glutamate N-acetyltransferase/amino-acid N-acetyltransferase